MYTIIIYNKYIRLRFGWLRGIRISAMLNLQVNNKQLMHRRRSCSSASWNVLFLYGARSVVVDACCEAAANVAASKTCGSA